ncbi:MAG: NirD/YgiW/YdeI family stress tolerance protein [Lonepinella koalarum]|nr:NirD/YgiW/YdeI family stress tolerance protein [Lonepinella koalarum]
MKKFIAITSLLALSTTAFAGFTGDRTTNGGFKDGSTAGITTVQQALKGADNAPVVLQGNIIKRLKDDDEFLFRDSTGEIVIEVEDEAWNGQEIGPSDKITIEGKVDTHTTRKSSIDVHYIKKH